MSVNNIIFSTRFLSGISYHVLDLAMNKFFNSVSPILHVIEKDRGVDYTGGGAAKSYSSGSDFEDGGTGQKQQRQQQQRQPSFHRMLVVKKDGSRQQYICLALRFLLKQIPHLMSQPFVSSQGIRSREWVGAFSPLRSGVCMERLVQDLTVAEPQLGNLSAKSLYSFYNSFVSKGEVLLEILEEEEEDEEGALTERVDGDDNYKILRQEQQSEKTFRRTFVSEAAMQLARLDQDYRRRIKSGGGNRKRKADLSFADDTGVDSSLEVDWEAAVEDEQEDEETSEEDDMYRTRKRVATARSPIPQPATAEAPSSPSTSSSSSSTSTLPSTTLQQRSEVHQRPQRKYVANDRIGVGRGRSAATKNAGPEPLISYSWEAYNNDKVAADQLSRTLENTEREQSHPSKALGNLQKMVAHSRQQQRARFFISNASSAPDSHLDLGGVDTEGRTTATTTIRTTAITTSQPQQQPNLPHLDRSSTSTLSSTLTNTPALTNNTNVTLSNVNTFASVNTTQTANFAPVSNPLLEEAIRSFGQDIKVQITDLKNAYQNQQLQMIHLQEAVETQQSQLTAILDTLNVLVRQSTLSSIYNRSDKSKDIIDMSPASGDLIIMETAPGAQAPGASIVPDASAVQALPAASATAQAEPVPSPPAVQIALVPPLPATPNATTVTAKSQETEKTQSGTASTYARERLRQRYKLSAPAIPTYVSTTQQQYPRPLEHVNSKTEDAMLALAEAGARSSVAAATAPVASVGRNFYRSRSQPPKPPPESLGADSSAKLNWDLDMLVISELAAAAVIDLDRQLTKEQQQLLQLQSPLSPTSTTIGARVDIEMESSTLTSPTSSPQPSRSG